ncbi:S8 family peptidase [Truepera radiovictrix]|uniref:Peptidase S8 and S53 subtilisin kexin sedolisin n=1 Tax=Truepera radiovictrix (strain DSM 17093 / CIP 108686 / LMG 22925 / RQ-24) TaxID=649638 RepID=D7CWJ6_TRURR|nr:S8 family peptidase [Truepera radiovictrix]ADI14395.1 peptidase S8 and S53 subtilisin kexin sedolisin [Truepera radiovictrix DSM 17093]WMT57048.1 S8 family serine peptidase [Truepera radiovictrix]
MKRFWVPFILLLLAACGRVDTALPETAPQAGTPIEGQYIVALSAEDRGLAAQAQGAEDFALSVSRVAADLGVQMTLPLRVINGFVAENVDEAALRRLQSDPRVAYVEQDQVVSLSATQTNATWGLDRIDQRTLPLDGRYTYNTTAPDVTVYVIDTGIRADHQEFGGRVVGGVTAISDGRGSSDCNGHGTHVAGTVGGSTYGVAKGVRLFAVRVLDCAGSGANSGVIAGVDWVTYNHRKPAVANMSLGGAASRALDDAVSASIRAGVTYVVAAGNENRNACNTSPARVSAALTVGASTRSDSRASFSNFGSCVNLFAPGQDITAAWHTGTGALNTISGTSMASPHVAGAAALYLQNNRSASPSTVADQLIRNATTGVLSSIGTGSPNRLLFKGTW